MNGSQHICFTDSAGKALFSIPDNGLLCLFYGNGDRQCAQPRVNHLAGGNPVRKGSSQAIGSKSWACIGNSASQAWNVRQ